MVTNIFIISSHQAIPIISKIAQSIDMKTYEELHEIETNVNLHVATI